MSLVGTRPILPDELEQYVNQFIAEPSDIEHDKKLSNQKENLIAADKVLMASHFVKKSILNRINRRDA